jgi:hypothetical protein
MGEPDIHGFQEAQPRAKQNLSENPILIPVMPQKNGRHAGAQ